MYWQMEMSSCANRFWKEIRFRIIQGVTLEDENTFITLCHINTFQSYIIIARI